MSPAPPDSARAWAEVDLSAILHNLRIARQEGRHPDTMAVVKADAYGHGLLQVAHALDDQNLAYFGVANVVEARRLFEAGIQTPPYILGATMPSERAEIVARRWTPCLCSFEEIDHFESLGKITAHLALDTGMGRGGFLPHQLPEVRERLRQSEKITLTGIGSHLPVADEDAIFTHTQFTSFREAAATFQEFQSPQAPFHLHLPNSAGLLAYDKDISNLARPGLMLYGASPLPEWQEKLRPAMSLKARVTLIHELPAGHGVSYGRSLLPRDTRTAVIGIGYGDGYPRALSGKGTTVSLHHQTCPILGRVTMDQLIVDVTHLPDCRPGDVATLFGPPPAPLVTDLAQKAQTIPWELLVQITPRVQRIYHSR